MNQHNQNSLIKGDQNTQAKRYGVLKFVLYVILVLIIVVFFLLLT